MAKTRINKGWCVDGLTITPEGTWSCSVCGKHVSTGDQTTKGGWFDYDNNGNTLEEIFSPLNFDEFYDRHFKYTNLLLNVLT